MDRKMVNFIKERYPPGTRLRLNSMEDPYAPVAPGTEGKVDFVDDIGTIVQRQRESRTKVCTKTEAQKALSKLCSVQLSAQLEQQVLSILNLLSLHPEKIQPQLSSTADHDNSEFQRKLDSIMLVQPVDEAAARVLIFQEAAALYDQVNTSDYESKRLQRLFEKAAHPTALDSQLLKSSVAGIYVESLSVKFLLWNGQYIGKDDFK